MPLTSQIRALSAGAVVDAQPSGPVFDSAFRTRRSLLPSTLVPALPMRDRVAVAALTAGWLGALVAFSLWWFQPGHRVSGVGLTINSLLLLFLVTLPLYYVIACNRLCEVDPALPVPVLRVAFVVTKAPSEEWVLARTTLNAMLQQDLPYPYDVWLCDEALTPEVRAWCEDHDVQISTRQGVDAYQRTTWPRRTRCKEGNLAYFYDHYGYRGYDVVAQLDCDHVPAAGYLTRVVQPFTDPAVGYVAAPSVCDANTRRSWSARGRLHREATFHGPVQLGHNGGLAPVCIGSHYAVRTTALRQVGGLGPELAEDFTTAFLLNSMGWQGAFAIRAEAHGDGPLTFVAMLTQEFQWSRSLVTTMLDVVPRHLGRLPGTLRFRFVYSLSYYPLLATVTIGGLALPPVAVIAGLPWIKVNYLEFLLRWWLVSAPVLELTLLLRRRGLLRPADAPVISWELWLYCLARWPYITWGVLAAVAQRLRPRQISFRVTPKRRQGLDPLPARLIAPYVGIAVVLSGAALIGEVTTRAAAGYVGLCLLGAVVYAAVALAVPVLHAVEASHGASVGRGVVLWVVARPALLLAGAAAVPVGVAVALFPAYLRGVFGW
ncbi:MAG: glycosyltransferase family 2 protein [Pseudonocardiaceae bacterium]